MIITLGILLGILSLILITLIRLVTNRNDGYWKNKGIFEVPKGGSAFLPFESSYRETDLRVYAEIKRSGAAYGGTFEFGTPVLYVANLDLIRDVCIKSFENFTDMMQINVKKGDPHMYYMLFNMRGAEWKQMRNMMTPSFTTGRIKRMMHIFESSSDKMIAEIRRKTRVSNVVDMRALILRFTLDVIASTAFGVDTDLFSDKDSIFWKMGLKFQKTVSGWNVLKFFLLNYMPQLGELFSFRLSDAEADKFLSRMVMDCIAYRQRTGKTRDDMLQLMIGAKAATAKENQGGDGFQLTDDMVVAQSLLFILGGFDTVESLLNLCLYELAVNPDVQDKLYAEVKEAADQKDGLSYEVVTSLEYLNMVVSEAARKYPTGFRLNRICTQPYKLPDSNAVLPKEDRLIIPVYAIHHDPEYWPDPEKFDPLRFTKDKVAERHPMAYLPFGHGPRQCIGNRFALVETKVTVAKLLLDFKLEPCEKTEIPIKFSPKSVALKPDGSIWLRIAERQK